LQEPVLPARPALPVGQLNRKQLAPAFPVDADRDHHRLAGNDSILAHPFIAGGRAEAIYFPSTEIF